MNECNTASDNETLLTDATVPTSRVAAVLAASTYNFVFPPITLPLSGGMRDKFDAMPSDVAKRVSPASDSMDIILAFLTCLPCLQFGIALEAELVGGTGWCEDRGVSLLVSLASLSFVSCVTSNTPGSSALSLVLLEGPVFAARFSFSGMESGDAACIDSAHFSFRASIDLVLLPATSRSEISDSSSSLAPKMASSRGLVRSITLLS